MRRSKVRSPFKKQLPPLLTKLSKERGIKSLPALARIKVEDPRFFELFEG